MELIKSPEDREDNWFRPIAEYVARCREIMTEPSRFFRSLKSYSGGLALALPFGLVTIWLTSLINFFWSTTTDLFFARLTSQLTADFSLSSTLKADGAAVDPVRVMAKQFLLSAAQVVASPFLTVIGLFFTALVLLLLGRWVMPKRNFFVYSVSNIMLILNYACVGAWFSIIPIFGGLLSFFATQIFTIIGFRECFHVSTRRAAFVVLLPLILSVGAFFVLALLVSLMVLLGIYAVFIGTMQSFFAV